MRAVWLAVDERFLDERRRLGVDKKDELWDGVPTGRLRAWSSEEPALACARRRRKEARSRGERRWDRNLRQREQLSHPDATLARRDQISKRGLEGAELVVEILSPDDESRDKLPFYADVGVREAWLIDPNSFENELLTLREAAWTKILPAGNRLRSPLPGIELDSIEGVALGLVDGDDLIDV